jgi:AraC-like DNA-binding protein
MGFWEKSLRICKCICVHGRQGVRRIAQQTGLSKSSVHRLTQAMQRRNVHPESWVWETEAGHRWLMRLVVATLYPFGLKRGVGMDTMSAFFARLRLDRQVGCSPSALRGVMQAMEAALLETAGRWEKDGVAAGGIRLTRDTLSHQSLTARACWRCRGRGKSLICDNTASKRSGNPRLKNREAGVVPSEARQSKLCSAVHTG